MIVCHMGARVSHSSNTASKGQEEWLADQTDQFMITKNIPKTTFDVTGQLEHGLVKLFTYFTESTYFSLIPAHTSACSEMAQRSKHSLEVAK